MRSGVGSRRVRVPLASIIPGGRGDTGDKAKPRLMGMWFTGEKPARRWHWEDRKPGGRVRLWPGRFPPGAGSAVAWPGLHLPVCLPWEGERPRCCVFPGVAAVSSGACQSPWGGVGMEVITVVCVLAKPSRLFLQAGNPGATRVKWMLDGLGVLTAVQASPEALSGRAVSQPSVWVGEAHPGARGSGKDRFPGRPGGLFRSERRRHGEAVNGVVTRSLCFPSARGHSLPPRPGSYL